MFYTYRSERLENQSFKREQLFYLFHHLQITRASLVVEDEEIYDFVDLTVDEDLRYQLSKPGNIPNVYDVNTLKGKCPVCGKDIRIMDIDEGTENHITEDYECPNCKFKGTQWSHKSFIGHTSSMPEHNIESYRKLIQP
jgi:predicted RNA-binding Zn-ribbon protein involved in translation (DUF1610 family)